MEGNRLAAMASMGPMIRPEPARRAMVPRTARSALCKIPASPLARRMTATPKDCVEDGYYQSYVHLRPKGCPAEAEDHLREYGGAGGQE